MVTWLTSPSASRRSGICVVAMTSEATTTRPRPSSGIRALQALVASTTCSARTRPVSVVRVVARLPAVGSAAAIDRTGVRSKTSTPAAITAARRARAIAAGCTAATVGSSTPPRCTGEPVRAAASSPSSSRSGLAPAAAIARLVSTQAPIWLGLVAAHSQPSSAKASGMPWAWANSPILATASELRVASATAPSGPAISTSAVKCDHQVMAKPPLRPLAPAPQTSASNSATRMPGARWVSSSAVHSPVKPPPTIATSTPSSPRSAEVPGPRASVEWFTSLCSACWSHRARCCPEPGATSSRWIV